MNEKKTLFRLFVTGLLLALPIVGCGVGGLAPTTAPKAPAPTTESKAPAPATASKAPANTPLPTTAPTDTPVPTTAPTNPPAVAGQEIRQWAVSAEASSQYDDPDFSALQATGAPNTLQCGDRETAWASLGSDEIAWLQLTYATPVRASQVNVIQTYYPNQVAKVELIDTAGLAHTIYTGQPQQIDQCPYTLSIQVQGADYLAAAVRITVDQSVVQEWNEIDAVELIGQTTAASVPAPPPASPPAVAGQEIRQWATSAEASSQYGDSDWSALQATGAPNTPQCGDVGTAWASLGSDEVAWLQLTYATPVRASQVNVIQTYYPNQVAKVELIDTAGLAHTIYTGQPQQIDQCPYTLSIQVQGADYLAAAVRITIDQSVVQEWNEIDAVELVGAGTR